MEVRGALFLEVFGDVVKPFYLQELLMGFKVQVFPWAGILIVFFYIFNLWN